MPKNIYTDDGILHEGVQMVWVYTNEAHTQMAPLVVSETKIQPTKTAEISATSSIHADAPYDSMAKALITGTTEVIADKGENDITFTSDKVIVDDGVYNTLSKVIPTTGAVAGVEKNILYNSDKKVVFFKNMNVDEGYIGSQEFSATRDAGVIAMPIKKDYITPKIKWTKVVEPLAEAIDPAEMIEEKIPLPEDFTGWCCVRYIHTAPGGDGTSGPVVSFETYFTKGQPIFHKGRYWSQNGHNSLREDYKFLQSGDTDVPSLPLSFGPVKIKNGYYSIASMLFPKTPVGAIAEALVLPMDFSTLKYTEEE